MSETHRKPCDWAGCRSTSEALLHERPLCCLHFYEVAHRRLLTLQRELDRPELERFFPRDTQAFLSELVGETTVLSATALHLNPGLREGLLRLSTSAADLYNKVRRAPRLSRHLDVILSSESPARRAERTSTINISSTGASLETSLSLQTDQTVWLERPGVPKKMRARVVWMKQLTASRHAVGLAFSSEDEDFWSLPVQRAAG
jgi:PilZ domain